MVEKEWVIGKEGESKRGRAKEEENKEKAGRWKKERKGGEGGREKVKKEGVSAERRWDSRVLQEHT